MEEVHEIEDVEDHDCYTPQWIPGEACGKKVDVSYTIPLRFDFSKSRP